MSAQDDLGTAPFYSADLLAPHLPKSVQQLVRDDLVVREELGRRRYGTALFPFDGRNTLVDAYQESMDMTLYLRKALVEQGIDPNEIVDQPPPRQQSAALPPEQAACRSRADDEQASIDRRAILALIDEYNPQIYGDDAGDFINALERLMGVDQNGRT